MNLIADTKTGKIEGFTENDLICFHGIPYALPPKKELRFKPPQPVKPWEGNFNAKEYGPIAPQIIRSPTDSLLKRKIDEDCLNLDIWTPNLKPEEKYPVFIWIHGGGFVMGNSGSPLINCHSISKRGNIVSVSINYRLGVLGLLYHPSLRDKESGICGNWAFLDQIAALKWISENIEAFGGDPNRITICGESAGGSSVAIHLQSPSSLPFFQQAISESGSPHTLSPEFGIKAAEQFFKDVGIDPNDRYNLINIPYEKLLKSSKRWISYQSFGLTACRPVRDGIIIPHSPLESVKAGLTKDKVIMFGSNRDEGKLIPLISNKFISIAEDEIKSYLANHIVEPIQNKSLIIEEIYNKFHDIRAKRGESTTPTEISLSIVNENYFRLPISRFLTQHKKMGGIGYNYLFTWESPNPNLGACHVLEIPFVLATLNTAPGMEDFAGTGELAEKLMEEMHNSWIDFIYGRNPGTNLKIEWPIYESNNRGTMIFGKKCEIQNQPLEEERIILEKYNITFHKL